MDTASLRTLESGDQRTILDLVDSLRRSSLDGVLSLPQLVVCGDQSSGKSSVLEAITEIPFPQKDNLCTRFATEIILCRATAPSIVTRVTPDKLRPRPERLEIENYNRIITEFSELPAIIDEATELMGIGKEERGVTRAFARDVLSIRIEGPQRPQLTLVDLPGLIHAESKSQSNEDIQLVSDLVHTYISEPRTLILAVVSARNDYANQIILQRCREVDPSGDRTLGVITKPDCLPTDSASEAAFISLSKNEDIFFALGWHVLKNRDYEDRHATIQQRNQSEAAFFAKGKWADLSRNAVGIESLVRRLSELLLRHIQKELPSLKEELEAKLARTCSDLGRLGESRSSAEEQRLYLTKLSMRFYDIAKAGVSGHYEDDFFGNTDVDPVSGSRANMRRLRAMIQHFNIQFARRMRIKGRKFKFSESDSEGTDDEIDHHIFDDISESEDNEKNYPISKSREEAFDWVERTLIRTRGQELPGNFNPYLISALFWEQSENWQLMTTYHMERVSGLCEEFVKQLLDVIAPEDVSTRLQACRIDENMRNRFREAETELSRLIADLKRYPITYNHYYTITIQKMRKSECSKAMKKSIKAGSTFVNAYDHNRHYIDDAMHVDDSKVLSTYEKTLELNMDRHSCQDALKCLHSYYQLALKTYIDNVAVQVVERHIIQGLETIFSPMVVTGMSGEEISDIVSEPPSTTRKREYLEARKRTLEKGRDTFKMLMRRAQV